MVLFLLFLSELFVLFLLSRSLTRSISFLTYNLTHSKKITIHVIAWLFFPGTLLHELSHAIMAGVLGVRVGTMEFMPTIEGDRVKLGSVQVAQTDYFRRFLIGAAPFFFGTTILLLILFFTTQNNLLENYWVVLLVGYVVFEIGNTMFSSKKDMEGAMELLLTILIISVIFYFLGVRLPALNPDIIFSQPLIQAVLQKGTIFLLVPIILDLAVIGSLRFIRK